VQAGLEVSEALDPQGINRVLLITDGQANVGETRIDALVGQARDAAGRGVTTTTIGIGRDFNEDLLMPMAEAGGGNAWHVEEPQDMVRIFETELQGLVGQAGHSVYLDVHTEAGVRVVECLNDFDNNGHRWGLPNLLGASTLDLLFRIEVTAEAARKRKKVTFTLGFTDQKTGEKVTQRESFSPQFASAHEVGSLTADPAVVETVQLLTNARARREAMERMDGGDYAGSSDILKSVMSSTRAAAAAAPSAALYAEIEDLERLSNSPDPIMARKMAAYQRERRRKGR